MLEYEERHLNLHLSELLCNSRMAKMRNSEKQQEKKTFSKEQKLY